MEIQHHVDIIKTNYAHIGPKLTKLAIDEPLTIEEARSVARCMSDIQWNVEQIEMLSQVKTTKRFWKK